LELGFLASFRDIFIRLWGKRERGEINDSHIYFCFSTGIWVRGLPVPFGIMPRFVTVFGTLYFWAPSPV
jgi:hypothetical protein